MENVAGEMAVFRRAIERGSFAAAAEDPVGAFDEMVLAQGLGDEDRQAPRHEKGDRSARTSVGRDPAPNMG